MAGRRTTLPHLRASPSVNRDSTSNPCGDLTSEEPAVASDELLASAGFRYATLLLDGDEEGRAAIPDALDRLGRTLYVRALELPDGVKPDTMSDAVIERLQ